MTNEPTDRDETKVDFLDGTQSTKMLANQLEFSSV